MIIPRALREKKEEYSVYGMLVEAER